MRGLINIISFVADIFYCKRFGKSLLLFHKKNSVKYNTVLVSYFICTVPGLEKKKNRKAHKKAILSVLSAL